jgi:ubiquinone/menaquinone biosynthesis C-methylase UbiE
MTEVTEVTNIVEIDEQQYVVDVYNKIASDFSNTRHYWWTWVKEYITSIFDNADVIDIGCGNGRNMIYGSNRVKCVGVDNSIKLVNIARSYGLNVVCADMCKLPFNNYTFDRVLSIASFHHLNSVDRRIQSLKEMKRIMKNDDSEICLSVWSINQPKKTRRTFDSYGNNFVKWCDDDVRFYYIFRIEEITELFTQVGLIVSRHYWDTGNEIFILKKTKW